MQTTQIGNRGEQLAAEALIRDGYEIIIRNWKDKIAEIDIIAKKHDTIYFVEVKYRKNSLYGDGFDYITPAKLLRMERAAALWISKKGWQGDYQLLATAVDGSGGEVDIREI